jgi:hypothetical protein
VTVVATTSQLASFCALISGVTTSFGSIPRVVQDADLPAIVILPGRAVYDQTQTGENDVVEDRIYQVMLLVKLALQGTENQVMTEVLPFFQTVRDYFLARPGMEVDKANNPTGNVVYHSELLGDSGFQIIPYPDPKFYGGIVFDVRVQEWAAVSFAD